MRRGQRASEIEAEERVLVDGGEEKKNANL
jgi:hypothetical protein